MTAKKNNIHDPGDDNVVLLMQVPRTNDKKELAAEQMFASLHGLLTFPAEKFFDSPKYIPISFEIAVMDKRIGFYVCIKRSLKDFVEEQIYAQYPTVQIKEIEDYSRPSLKNYATSTGTELQLVASDVLPIKTFQSFEVDPLAAITATLAKFEPGEEAWIQLLIRPAKATWHKKSERYVANMRGTSSSSNGIFSSLWAPPSSTGATAAKKLTEFEQAKAKGAEEKSHKLGFDTVLRIVYKGGVSQHESNLRLQSIVAGYKQFATTYMNGFHQGKIIADGSLEAKYHRREFSKRPYVLNIEEVATLFHLPHTNVETPYILWASSQTSEPPANLPIVIPNTSQENISPMGGATFRGLNTPFGLPRTDRSRHLYILGQTGVGKSALLELLTISDIYSPYGFAIVDPHGDYVMSVLRRIPAARAKDVIYFNPADVEFPIAFNPMEVIDSKLKTQTASELIGVLKRMFDSWGPRLEYILRYCLLALLEYPNATMLDITRILTDKKFREKVLEHVTDPVVRNFWTVEFTSWNDRFAAEAVSPVLNKVGAFTANPIVRNIIGQPKSSFNIREIMDNRKILLVNLSRGVIGEDNAAILGALMVTKMQLAAMSRADMPSDQRVPFYLYVDEFQNFATDSFATILSEARKYALNLTVANQYIAQMPPDVKDAVFGNVGSMIAFRMGADDSRTMQKYFEPKFSEYDLVHMHNRHFVINMTIDGEKTPAFSGVTLDLPAQNQDETDSIIAHSRQAYALHRSEVESEVSKNYTPLKDFSVPREPASTKTSVSPRQYISPAAPNPVAEKGEKDLISPEIKPEVTEPPANLPIDSVGKTATKALRLGPLTIKSKRKRRRKRKSKPEAEITSTTTEKDTIHPPKNLGTDDETVIFKR